MSDFKIVQGKKHDYYVKGNILKYNFAGKEWCVPWRCPCLTCELWNQEEIKIQCWCAPCEKRGLMCPEDHVCWKTTNGMIPARTEDGRIVKVER